MSRQRFCSHCGDSIDGGNFCSSCGRPVTPRQGGGAQDRAPLPSEGVDAVDWAGRFERATSFRVGCVSLLVGAMVAGLLGSFLWRSDTVTGWVGLALAALVWVGAVMNDDQAMKCPRCRKRVKLGADTCHHCGAFTGRASA